MWEEAADEEHLLGSAGSRKIFWYQWREAEVQRLHVSLKINMIKTFILKSIYVN